MLSASENLCLHWAGQMWTPVGPRQQTGACAVIEDEHLNAKGDEWFEAASRGILGTPGRAPSVPWQGIPIEAGCHVILGTAGSGKTKVAGMLQREFAAQVVNWGEPEGYSARPSLTVLCHLLTKAFRTSPHVVLDSIKTLSLMSTENVGRGGLSKAPLVLVDDLSGLCAARRLRLFVVMNPFDLDKPQVSLLADALAAVSTSVWHLQGATENRVTLRVRDRRAARQWREHHFHESGNSRGADEPAAPDRITSNHIFTGDK